MKSNHNQNKNIWHSISKRLHYVLDIVMFFISLTAAIGLLMFHKAGTTSNQNQFIHLTTSSKNKTKKAKVPKSQLAIGEAYQLIPKKKVKRYKTVVDIYGYSYKQKLKKPKITYLANFYLDPNYASKSLPVKNTIYISLEGTIVEPFKTPQAGQYNFVNSSLGYNSTAHYVLNDSSKYIQVMQFKSYAKYGEYTVPNASNDTLNLTLNAGPNRYLKLSEFKLKRVKNVNLSQKAQESLLFGGYVSQ